MAVVGWVLAAVLAALDWYAVATERRTLEHVAKPGTMLALIGTAAAMDAGASASGRLLLVALALGLLGDILLIADDPARFLGGLAAFLLGHLAYAGSFLTLGLDRPWWGLVGVLALAAGALPVRWVLTATHREGGAALAVPVAAYVLVIGAMTVLAWATGRPLAGLGATVFLASDTMLALNRFVRPHRWAGPAVMVTYHVGQALIVLGVLRT